MSAFPRLACAILEIARCPRMGNTGAGATTSERPMLISPTPRIGPCTIGGGATTEAVGPAIACRAETASTAGGGATMESSGRPSRRDVVWLTAGGGATTEPRLGNSGSCKLLALELGNAASAGIGVTSGRPGLAILMSGGSTARVRPRVTATIG